MADLVNAHGSLLGLAAQFKATAQSAAFPEPVFSLGNEAEQVLNAAWDGTLYETICGRQIPLLQAITTGRAALQAARDHFLVTKPAEITAALGPGAFDVAALVTDVVRAFQKLETLDVASFGQVDFNNIQAALAKHENAWRSGPHKDEVFVVQQTFLSLCNICNGLWEIGRVRLPVDQRRMDEHEAAEQCRLRARLGSSSTSTGARSEVPPAGQSNVPTKMPVEYGTLAQVPWPAAGSIPVNWVEKFPLPREDDQEGRWLTPRMACMLHHAACYKSDDILFVFSSFRDTPYLPKVARPFFKKSAVWRTNFVECHKRIVCRLAKGMTPHPNCTGEEMALHNIISWARDLFGDYATGIEDELEKMPGHPSDTVDDPSQSNGCLLDAEKAMRVVRDLAFEDHDVLMLFEDGDHGFDDESGDEEEDDPCKSLASARADFMLGTGGRYMGATHLHPQEWFVAFKRERIRDHMMP